MEKISEIFDNVKERLSSRFLFSFLVSWLFLKWQIIVALCWYDISQINKEGYTTIYDFIQGHEGNIINNLLLPLIAAIIYTFGVPFLNNWIKAFQTWITKKRQKRVFEISKESVISFEKHVEGLSEAKKQVAELKVLIDEQNNVKAELQVSREAIVAVNKNFNELQNQYNDLQTVHGQMRRVEILAGRWTFITIEATHYIEISNNNIYFNDAFGNREGDKNNMITSFFFDANQKRILFIRHDIKNGSYYVNDLEYQNRNRLVGTENGVHVQYNRFDT